jgi:light-regulated signal transduction histidine kinase (bacteriophytochrome)
MSVDTALNQSSTLFPDLIQCEREPIHIPGSVQPHVVLLIVREHDLVVTQASTNASQLFGIGTQELCGQGLDNLLSAEEVITLRTMQDGTSLDGNPQFVCDMKGTNGEIYSLLAHRHDGLLLLEWEINAESEALLGHNLFTAVREGVTRWQNSATIGELAQYAVEEVRSLTGFDKVMVYRFDAEWNGTVIGEARVSDIESYYDLRFPASDIPVQARQLYLKNRLRLIADVNYTPVRIEPTLNPETSRSPDLSFATGRSVSPVHLEYLRNMEVGSSMSISIIKDGQLWGLIACHHRTSKRPSHEVRTACEFLGQALALQISSLEQRKNLERRLDLGRQFEQLLTAMARVETFAAGLKEQGTLLLDYAAAQGAAIVFDDDFLLMGNTPSENAIRSLCDELTTRRNDDIISDITHVTQLTDWYPPSATWDEAPAGLLALSLSRVRSNWVLFFRPEVVQTVKWGGDPHKPMEPTPDGMRLHPRKSFAVWRETVRGRALPWQDFELEAVRTLRHGIIEIVLRQAEERAQLTTELEMVQNELDAFSYSVSHDLRAPFRHITGFSELLRNRIEGKIDERERHYLNTVNDAARHAGALVDNLIAFYDMRRAPMRRVSVDMNLLLQEVMHNQLQDVQNRNIEWKIDTLPVIYGDPDMLRIVMGNYLSNAIKFTANRDPAVIEVGMRSAVHEIIFWVRDNGVGFDTRYAHKLFGVFQRLHTVEEFAGIGIGLANARRLITRHRGRTWAEGERDKGATFYFAIPVREISAVRPRQDI